MAPPPLVSVIIPAYNAASTIRRAVDSALAQDYPAFEIVVIDDASHDMTADIVAEYGSNRVKLLRLAQNQGESGAMNEGIAVARGTCIAFLDADDEWLPDKLSHQMALLEANPKASMVSCGCLFVDQAGRTVLEFGMPPAGFGKAEIWRALLVATCIAKPCVVARAAAIREVGPFDTALRIAADQDMWIRLAMVGEVEFVPEYLTRAHDTPGSLTKVHVQRIHRYVLPMVLRHLDRRRGDLDDAEIRHILSERYTTIGRNLYTHGSAGKGFAWIVRAILLGGRRAENSWYLLTASPPARLLKRLIRGAPAVPPAPPVRSLIAPGASSLLAPRESELAEQRDPRRPVLIVAVDTEAEFEWGGPFRRTHTSVRNLSQQSRAQAIFDRFGVRPVYLVDYAVATQPEGYGPLREILRAGRCEIGAHLQPWETPPFDEELGERTSFNNNLPAWLQKEKLARLTEAIVGSFGVRPVAYRAGRYGVGEEIAWILEAMGYRIDLSVVPGVDLRRKHGPDFRRAFSRPYWFGRNRSLLEIPVTAGYTGLFASRRLCSAADTGLYGALSHPSAARLRAPGVFARLGLLERITLTPEGISIGELKRLTGALLARGNRVFTLNYHSSSLLPGNTPYVRSAADLDGFLNRLGSYLAFFLYELGGVAMTPSEYRATLLREADAPPARRQPELSVATAP